MNPSRRAESIATILSPSSFFDRSPARRRHAGLCNVALVATTTRSRGVRRWRLTPALCIITLGALAVLGAGCAGGSTTTPDSTPRTSVTTNTAWSSTTTATATVCQLVRSDLAVVGTNSTLPINDGQRLLAEAQGSGNRQLTTEALALASASHTLDAQGVAKALQQMSESCHSVGH